MKSPEEEADNELGKRLREKFEGYKVPGKDRVRKPVFAALDKSPNRLYWIPLIGGLFLIASFLLLDWVQTPADFGKKDSSIFNKNKTGNTTLTQAKPGSKTQQGAISKDDLQLKHAEHVLENNVVAFKKQRIVQKQNIKMALRQGGSNYTLFSLGKSALIPGYNNIAQVNTENHVSHQTDINVGYHKAHITNLHPAELELLSPIDSVNMVVSFDPFTIAPPTNAIKEAIKKPSLISGVRGIFSISMMQTFQLVNLSPSAEDRVQNLQFVPLLSSKSLSYKLTAGVEKKHTQFLLSYTYMRNWNEYEIGTNQVLATRVDDNQYLMTIIGEKHLEDERSHLLGVGIRQRLMIPPNILRNYSINVGVDYTRLMIQNQDLVWGNIGFYKNIYRPGGTRLEIGPYFQYSFTEREVARQTWKSRPYQVGILLGVKIK